MTGLRIDEPDPRLLELLAEYPPDLFDRTLYRSVEWADRYTLALCVETLRHLRMEAALADETTAGQVLAKLSFSPAFLPTLRWLLAFLALGGVLARNHGSGKIPDAQYRLEHPLPDVDLDGLRAQGIAIDPGNARTLALLDAAAEAYTPVALGTSSGEQALLAPGSIELWLDYFHSANTLYSAINRLAALAAARRLVTRGSNDVPSGLRILEVGAGAGSGTAALLHTLSEAGTLPRVADMLITEPNDFFRRRAERSLRARYRHTPLRYAPLDMNRQWAEQGVPPGSLDLVFAVNALHVARDLKFTLAQARKSLAPGGQLVAGECIRPFPGQPIYVEMAFLLLDSYVRVETDPWLRPDAGFLAPEHWEASLATAGFRKIVITPDQRRVRELYTRLFPGAVCALRE